MCTSSDSGALFYSFFSASTIFCFLCEAACTGIKLAIAYDLYYNQMKKLARYQQPAVNRQGDSFISTNGQQVDYERSKDAFSIFVQAQVLADDAHRY